MTTWLRRLVPPLLPLVVLFGLLLPAIQPLLAGHLPWRADGLLHFHRLAQLEWAVSLGALYPRWLPDLSYGYGFPLFNYYAPLSYYLTLPWRWLGFSVAGAMQLGYATGLLALGGAMFIWARGRWGLMAGWAAAVAAVYAPYILYNGLHRGALPELWGLAWLAFTFAAVDRFRQKPGRWSGAAVSLTFAALMLTHNILALIGTPFLLLYAYWELPWRSDKRPQAFWLALLLLLGLGLSAFFWLPALAEKDLVQIDQLTAPANFHYGNNFLPWPALLPAPRPADPAQVNPAIPFGLGWPQFLLLLLAWWPGPKREQKTGRRWPAFEKLLGLLGLAILMSLPVSRPLWDHLPLLPFVQFPWRFLGPASLLLALLAGAGVAHLEQWDRRWPPVAVAGLLIFSLFWLFPAPAPPQTDPTPLDTIRFEQESGALGTTSAADYLPVTVAELPPPDSLASLYGASGERPIPRLNRDILPAGVDILAEENGFTAVNLQYRAAHPFTAQFHHYYFPGWQARLNGQPVEAYAAGPHGLLSVDLPAGEQQLTVSFGSTPLRRLAGLLSGGALLLLAAWLLFAPVGGEQQKLAARPGTAAIHRAPVAALLLFTLALLAVKLAYLEQADTIFRRSAFDGEQLTQVGRPLQVNFGDQLLLLGYDLPRRSVAADELVEIDLYWRVLPPVQAEYSVAVHLVDDQGRRFGEHDSFHPANYPTTRWQAGEYGRDQHRLTIWPGALPGVYQLWVTVYGRADGRQLEYRNEIGQPLGLSYPLTELAISWAQQQPAATDLPLDPGAEQALGGGLVLIGWPGLPAAVTVGQPLPFTLFWRTDAVPRAVHYARLQLLDARGEAAAVLVWPPGRDSFQTADWPPGVVARDERALLIPAARNGDPAQPFQSGQYTAVLDLLDEQSGSLGTAVALADIHVQVPERRFDLPAGSSPSGAFFGDLVELAAYRLEGTFWRAGDTLPLTLIWRALALSDQPLAVFVHLVGEDGRIYSQQDQPPLAGARPITSWLPGEILTDPYQLWLPPDLPPGVYELRVGLYNPVDGRRLPLAHSDQDFWTLPITITGSE